MTYKFVINCLTNCPTLLFSTFWKEKYNYLILLVISKGSKSQNEGVPYNLKYLHNVKLRETKHVYWLGKFNPYSIAFLLIMYHTYI